MVERSLRSTLRREVNMDISVALTAVLFALSAIILWVRAAQMEIKTLAFQLYTALALAVTAFFVVYADKITVK